MNILILGAGKVGAALARHLAVEPGNHIVVVDDNHHRLQALQQTCDVETVHGLPSLPATLRQAKCDKADLIYAVAPADEVNILACHIAHRYNPTARKLCRMREASYWDEKNLIATDTAGERIIEKFISPQRIVSHYLESLLEIPGALQVVDFAEGQVRLVVVKVYPKRAFVNQSIRDIRAQLPPASTMRIVAIYRRGVPIALNGDSVIEAHDELFFISHVADIEDSMKSIGITDRPYSHITIAGGGRIGHRLARHLETRAASVKVIDHNDARLHTIAPSLNKTILLHGEATDAALFLEEQLNRSDVFLALTSSDESNILSAMLAKSMHTKKVMALVNRPEYVALVENSQIDIAISPDQVCVSSMLDLARQNDTAHAYPLRRGMAEILEIIVHEDGGAQCIGRTVRALDAPAGIQLGAIIRAGQCVQLHGDTEILAEDHIVVFVNDRALIPKVETLFGKRIGG